MCWGWEYVLVQSLYQLTDGASYSLPDLRDTKLYSVRDTLPSSIIRLFVKSFVYSIDIGNILEQSYSQ